MKKANERRFEFHEVQTASMWMAGSRGIIFPRDPMKTWLPWILCGTLMLMGLGLCEVLALPDPVQRLTLLLIPTCTLSYTLNRWARWRYCWHIITKSVDKRCLENPDGRYEYTYWIEGDYFHAARWKSKRSVWLGSFQRMICRKDLVVLSTGRKWESPWVFHRASLTDEQWREISDLIRAANPKFQSAFK